MCMDGCRRIIFTDVAQSAKTANIKLRKIKALYGMRSEHVSWLFSWCPQVNLSTMVCFERYLLFTSLACRSAMLFSSTSRGAHAFCIDRTYTAKSANHVADRWVMALCWHLTHKTSVQRLGFSINVSMQEAALYWRNCLAKRFWEKSR